MGPAATVAFLARVQALTPAGGDADHIRVVMDLNPRVPDRNTHPGSARTVLSEMARGLVGMGAEVLAMPCNTAHAQASGIRSAGVPFIEMIAETVATAEATGAQWVGVLATPGGEALYRTALRERGLALMTLDGADRERFMSLIYGVKRGEMGEAARAEMRRLAGLMANGGAGAVIAGCTEVPLLLSQADVAVPLVDSSEVLARACVAACLA